MLNLLRFLLFLAIVLPISGFTDDLNDAFNDAKNFSEGKNSGLFSSINDQAVSGIIPYYGVQPDETALFHGGEAQLRQSGVDKVSNCDGFTPSGNAMLDQDCDAVNFIAKHPQVIQSAPINPSDPMFQTTAAARSNAPAVFQSTGITTGESGQCTTETRIIPETTTSKVCSVLKEIDAQDCLASRNIVFEQIQDPNTGIITDAVKSSDYDTSMCNSLSSNASYQRIGSECISTAPLQPLPDGINISDVAPDGCFVMRHSYAGLTGVEDNSDCALLDADAACTFQGNGACRETFNTSGSLSICTDQEKKYTCTTSQETSYNVQNCSGQKYCVNDNCFDTSDEPDTDFAQAASVLEVARQAGVYLNEQTMRVFDGAPGKCRIKLGGVTNCCKASSGGGSFNNNVLFNIAAQVGSNAISYGSKYLYDALYTSDVPNWMIKGISAIYSVDPYKIPAGGLLSAWSPSLSYFGFTVSLGEIAPGFVSNLTGIGVVQTELFSGSGIWVGFDPTSVAISAAIMVVQEMLSCEQDEQILSMRRGENLCSRVGSYCSKKVFGVCLERKRSYCCYNSRLGRIINEQGRAQLGKGWGSPKNPDCRGFTQQEFASINFAALDLAEFTHEVMRAVSMPNINNLTGDAQTVINKRVQTYYETGSQIQ